MAVVDLEGGELRGGLDLRLFLGLEGKVDFVSLAGSEQIQPVMGELGFGLVVGARPREVLARRPEPDELMPGRGSEQK